MNTENVLNRNLFLVKEHPGLLKAANNYDILDPETGVILMECREERIGGLTRILRFTDLKRTTPFDIRIRTAGGAQILRMIRGVPVVASMVHVYDDTDTLIGTFRQKPFSISGAFDVLDAEGKAVCKLKGGLTGWNFHFVAPDNLELAMVTKKWAGLGKELFTSADNYVLTIDEIVPLDSLMRQLILASVLCIGLIQKIEIP